MGATDLPDVSSASGLSRGVVQHSRLELRGGMARVANLLWGSLRSLGVPSARTFEEAETHGGAAFGAGQPWLPSLRQAIRSGLAVHLHGTSHWPSLLQHLAADGAEAGRIVTRPVITLHDMQLLTGGCVYTAGCPLGDNDLGAQERCAGPCPRGQIDPPGARRVIGEQLRALRPVLVSPSRWMRDQASGWLPDVPCRVIPNGVEWPDAPPDRQAARSHLGLAQDVRLVLFCAHGGTAAVWKAGDGWERLWSRIKVLEPRAVGFMVGGQQQDLRGVGDCYVFSYVDRATMHTLLAAADVLIHPSLADNHPLIILEAMAASCCVVASSVGGIVEQVQHGRTGLLVKGDGSPDFEGLAQHAARLLGRPSTAWAMGERAFEFGGRAFTQLRMARDYLEVYREAASETAC